MVLKRIKNKGFTLIEMLVAIMIFSLVIGIISGIFVSSLRLQREALASQTLLEQTSYALEYISRTLRMAKKELGEGCLSEIGLNYEIPAKFRINLNPNLGTGLRFINHLEGDDCQEFFLKNGQLKIKKRIGGPEEIFALTSPELQITSLRFNLSGQREDDGLQPRVTIFLDIKGEGFRPERRPEIKIQTTISQRDPDFAIPK